MKYIIGSILIISALVSMTGCYEPTPAIAVHRGVELCKPNGGIKQFWSSKPVVKVDCVNGARFIMNARGDELTP